MTTKKFFKLSQSLFLSIQVFVLLKTASLLIRIESVLLRTPSILAQSALNMELDLHNPTQFTALLDHQQQRFTNQLKTRSSKLTLNLLNQESINTIRKRSKTLKTASRLLKR